MHRVDLTELEAVVGDLVGCERLLERLASDLDRRMALLHEEWDGLAAEAQARAHESRRQGLSAMRDALGSLRAAASTAGENCSRAVEANVAMWAGLE